MADIGNVEVTRPLDRVVHAFTNVRCHYCFSCLQKMAVQVNVIYY